MLADRSAVPVSEPRRIAIRTYTVARQQQRRREAAQSTLSPSAWCLIFDTETTIDAAQQLRIGSYQVREAGELVEAGFFYDPDSLSDAERSTLYAYAARHSLDVRTVGEFVEGLFYPVLWERHGTLIGFNLAFDIARLAIYHSAARFSMRGGFSFMLAPDLRLPRVQVRHLNSRTALYRFAMPDQQNTPRSRRKRGQPVPHWAGAFIDVRTIAAALLAESHSLGSLADRLGTAHRKGQVEGHGGELTAAYLDYALGDVAVTWECYAALARRYAGFGLTGTPLHRIYSEASVGKAYLAAMGIRPRRVLQPDIPPAILGAILNAYYGGRSEMKLRAEIRRVTYCDFRSEYPSVCVLQRLWQFVIAERLTWADDTDAVRAFLAGLTVEQLAEPATWAQLHVLVQVEPDADIFPVRADYDAGGQRTIGVNYLSAEFPIWYTLADCAASTLLTGKPPRIVRAIRFRPEGVQEGLQPVNIAGNPLYRVDPDADDFYRTLIDLRSAMQREQKAARTAGDPVRAELLDAEQLATKITANATSYGIFIEANVEHFDDRCEASCIGLDGTPFAAPVYFEERPGRYFDPLLATLITGAARLMLALAEHLATREGIEWAFCDTDSMAFARPVGMADADFLARVDRVRGWFAPLYPYREPGELFKLEDPNFVLRDGKLTGDLAELEFLGISAKRYALFTRDAEGLPVLRKASAHGLGQLRAPYGEIDAPAVIPAPAVPKRDLGVDRWQHDVWYRIVLAQLAGHPAQVELSDLPALDKPAMSEYAATTPALLHWFDRWNAGKPYREQLRPFGFISSFQAQPLDVLSASDATLDEAKPKRRGGRRRRPALPHPVAPFDTDPATAALGCFDRLRPESPAVPVAQLKSYRAALAQYHLHPEAKFRHGDYSDRGPTERRHVLAQAGAVDHIGKEADLADERFHLGADLSADLLYPNSAEGHAALRERAIEACQRFGVRELVRRTGLSLGTISALKRGIGSPGVQVLARVVAAANSAS
jgi:DNA polymerase III epsilon subunit-like protein